MKENLSLRERKLREKHDERETNKKGNTLEIDLSRPALVSGLCTEYLSARYVKAGGTGMGFMFVSRVSSWREGGEVN